MGVERREGLSIEELAEQAGVPVRTIRYYIAEGLLPGPGARGKGALYTEDHLLRLRLIRRLVEQHVPLAEIRERLALLSTGDLRRLLAEEERQAPGAPGVADATSAREYIAALLQRARSLRTRTLAEQAPRQPAPAPQPAETWRRIVLAPGVELHVRADAERRYRALVQRLLQAASGEEQGGPEAPPS